MTDDNSTNNLVDIPEDLKDFKGAFFSTTEPVEDEGEDTEDDALATETDKDASVQTEDEDAAEEESEDEADGEDESDDEDTDDEPDAEPKDKGKRKKSDYQKRINELTRARHEAERRETILLQRLENLEKGSQSTKDSTQEPPTKATLPQGAPDPEAQDAEGNLKYPLGQYDPNFIYDMTQFTISETLKAKDEERAKAEAARQLATEQNALKANWTNKVDEYEEEVPEIRDHIADLVDSFQGLEPAYGEYIATTIMQCDNGPAIMEYLSQNIGEAQEIVASGPAAATRAIGRLEAKLSLSSARSDAEDKRNKKTSEAPPPPAATVKGTKSKSSVRPDTTNLAAFKREFYK